VVAAASAMRHANVVVDVLCQRTIQDADEGGSAWARHAEDEGGAGELCSVPEVYFTVTP